jgi:phosphoethanolamine N-methyltransferase
VPHHILRSEAIYGEGFQSPGGLDGFKRILLPKMRTSAGMRLMDIGSGLGGAAFFLGATMDVDVVGVDSSEVMVSLATDRKPDVDPGDRVRFVFGDVYADELKEGSFDAVYSRDSLLYEADKDRLLARCRRLLKPGRGIYLSDFCRGKSTDEFEDYVTVSGYHLLSVPEYISALSRAGFVSVVGEDASELTRQYLERDLDRYRANVEAAPDSISKSDANHIVERWLQKINFVKEGCLVQGVLSASTPMSD